MNNSDNFKQDAMAGVNIGGISNLCISINFYASKIKKELDEISDLVDDSKYYFDGDTKDDFFKKFNDIISEKKIIKDNISSYIDDYNAVVNKFKLFDNSITFNKIGNENGGK